MNWTGKSCTLRMSFAGGTKKFFETEGYDPRSSNVLRMLGYFSLVGLSRVHALIGDFYTSLQALHPLNPFLKKNLYTSKVAGIHCPQPSLLPVQGYLTHTSIKLLCPLLQV